MAAPALPLRGGETIKHDIGSYRLRAEVLQVVSDGTNYEWACCGKAWCRLDNAGVHKIFSHVGIGADGWTVTMRDIPALTKHNALRIGPVHYFIADLDRPERGYLTATVVSVPLVTVTANAEMPAEERFTFPACLTELYVKHEQRDPMSINVIDYVLVTPKEVRLQAGSLVEMSEVRYEVLAAHTLDEAKNEYEVRRTEDL